MSQPVTKRSDYLLCLTLPLSTLIRWLLPHNCGLITHLLSIRPHKCNLALIYRPFYRKILPVS
jgi:hypothetical protein